MKHETPGQQHGIKRAVVILLAVLGGVFLLHSCNTEDRRPSDRTSHRTFSGPIEDGYNGLNVSSAGRFQHGGACHRLHYADSSISIRFGAHFLFCETHEMLWHR